MRGGGKVIFFCLGAWAWTLAGCGRSEDLKLVPVIGKALVDGKPLKNGSVSFRPDKAKGNNSPHQADGDIDAEGKYTLYTKYQAGAPPGWYKVAVVSAEPGAYPPKTLYINAKYASPDTSQIWIEVKESAAADAYDLKLTK